MNSPLPFRIAPIVGFANKLKPQLSKIESTQQSTEINTISNPSSFRNRVSMNKDQENILTERSFIKKDDIPKPMQKKSDLKNISNTKSPNKAFENKRSSIYEKIFRFREIFSPKFHNASNNDKLYTTFTQGINNQSQNVSHDEEKLLQLLPIGPPLQKVDKEKLKTIKENDKLRMLGRTPQVKFCVGSLINFTQSRNQIKNSRCTIKNRTLSGDPIDPKKMSWYHTKDFVKNISNYVNIIKKKYVPIGASDSRSPELLKNSFSPMVYRKYRKMK